MKYIIERKTNYIFKEEGDLPEITSTVRYYIKYEKKLFGLIPYWKYIGIDTHHYGDFIFVETSFRTLEAAEEFAKKYTCNGILPDTTITEIVKEFEC